MRSRPSCRGCARRCRHCAMSRRRYLYRGDDLARIERLDRIARANGCTILATNDVHYHAPERRPLQDVMSCIREKVTHRHRGLSAQPQCRAAFEEPGGDGAAVRRAGRTRLPRRANSPTRSISASTNCATNIRARRVPEGRTPQQYLEHLTWEGAKQRWPDGVPDKVDKQLRHELELIEQLDFARYFLTVHDIVAFARSLDPPILCQGRGSAANSAVCYLPRHHRGRPGDQRPAVRALHLRGAQGAARHRRRFRA